jgi:CRP/FNR family transcriptional regulator
MVFSDGEPGRGFYLVAEGRVKVYKISADGKEQILHLVGSGESIGAAAVFSGKSYPANAQAILKSRLLFFPRSRFVALLAENPELAMNLLAVFADRLREFTLQIESLSLKEIPGRLAAYLLDQSEKQKTPNSVRLEVSRSQLADVLGAAPESLSRAFASMTRLGLIDAQGPQIGFLNLSGLQELAKCGKGRK